MNNLTQKDLERIISLYLDGELDTIESKKLEEYIVEHPTAAKEFEILRITKKNLSSKEKLPANNWFWLKLSEKLESKQLKTSSAFFAPRSKFVMTGVTLLVMFIVGAVYYKDVDTFQKFFVEKKNLVQSSLLSGNILPLFANVTKDDVLNFALFGSITIDSSTNTELRVKNTDDKRAQVQIVRNENRNKLPAVSVTDFCDNIGISAPQQQHVVDSILGIYKQKLQTAVLVSENKEIAIHEGLADLNRAMVSTIVASLEPIQRVRFQKFLHDRNAPYALVAMNAPASGSQVILRRIPKKSLSNRYVVVSKDTIGIAEMSMNLDSIRETVHHYPVGTRQLTAEKFLHEIENLQQEFGNNVVVAGTNNNRIHVSSTNDVLQINFEAPEALPREYEMVDLVKPRMKVPLPPKTTFRRFQMMNDSSFVMEMHPDSMIMQMLKRLPQGEFQFEYGNSATRGPKVKLLFKSNSSKKIFERRLREMKQEQGGLIDLDSLLRESDRKSLQTQPKPAGKMYEL
ncbi:MAG: hypothetical protein PHP42_06305 [Bacteroidota bacterium]|nr:hypothetical protein [Bacteroidota bacterium]